MSRRFSAGLAYSASYLLWQGPEAEAELQTAIQAKLRESQEFVELVTLSMALIEDISAAEDVILPLLGTIADDGMPPDYPETVERRCDDILPALHWDLAAVEGYSFKEAGYEEVARASIEAFSQRIAMLDTSCDLMRLYRGGCPDARVCEQVKESYELSLKNGEAQMKTGVRLSLALQRLRSQQSEWQAQWDLEARGLQRRGYAANVVVLAAIVLLALLIALSYLRRRDSALANSPRHPG